jgi:uncharacterized protein (DUF2236 family)
VRNVFDGFPSLQTGRAGDPGLFGPGSAVWAIDAHLVTILGGGRALLMQLAHPSVAASVADHSAFEIDPFPRLWPTLDAVLTVAFGLDVADQPEDLAAFERYLTTAMTGLEIGQDARRLAAPILHPPVPRTLAPVAALLRLVTIGLLPPRLRAGFGLEWGGRRERALRAAASIIRSTRPLMPDVAQKWSHARVAEARSRARSWE